MVSDMTEEKLDKLAEKYQDDNTIIRYYGPGNGSVPEYNKTMAEVFKDGWNACKEQMMKEAVEGEISSVDVGDDSYVKNLKMSELQKAIRNYNVGDKVRVIIIKKED